MPRVDRKRRRRSKSAGRKRQGQSLHPSNAAVSLRGTFMPKTCKRIFNYVEKFTLDAGAAGTAVNQMFSMNSLYDPNRTGVGHQPLGFDQYLGVLYNHFVVIYATITLQCMSQSTTTPGVNTLVSIVNRDTSTSVNDAERAIEQGNCTFGILGSSDGGSSALTLRHECCPHKFLGISNPLSEDILRGNETANPQEEAFFMISCSSLSSDDPPAVDFLATIQYTAILTEPEMVAKS